MNKNEHPSNKKNNTQSKEKIMRNNEVNLLELMVTESNASCLGLVKIDSNETAITLFTAGGVTVSIHYCPETEIQSYVHCNGSDCLLCRIGREITQKHLLPVYLYASGCIGILAVGCSLRPYDLLPHILRVLKAEKPMVTFVTRGRDYKYSVSTVEIQKDVDGGDAVIERFQKEYEAGLHDLSAVYPRISNEDLANVEEIGRMMALKGIKCQ